MGEDAWVRRAHHLTARHLAGGKKAGLLGRG